MKTNIRKGVSNRRGEIGLQRWLLRLIATFLAFFLGLAALFVWRDYDHEVEVSARAALSILSEKSRDISGDTGFASLATALLRSPGAQVVWWLDANGNIREQYGTRLSGLPSSFDISALDEGGERIAHLSDSLVVAIPSTFQGIKGYIAFAVRFQGLLEHILSDIALITLITLVLVLFSVSAVLGFLRDVVTPISIVNAAMSKAASGERIGTVEPLGPPEVRAFMHAYNDLIEAMNQRSERLNNQRANLEGKLVELNDKETKLRDNEDWFRGIFNFSTEATVIIDDTGVIVEVNAAASQLFGYEREELINKRVEMLMPLDVRPNHQSYIARYLQTGTGAVIGKGAREVSGVAKNGELRALDLAIGTMRLRGKLYFMGVLHDATERRQARLELARARDQAVESARMKDAFLANINHELRTPLNGILGTLQLVDAAVTPDERKAYFEIIRESGRKLLSTVTQVLDFARIDAGTMELDRREMDPINLVMTAAQVLGAAITKNLYFVILNPTDLKVRMLADSLRLRQAINNVIENAIKFTEHGGVIVTLRAIQRENHGSFQIDVRDTGCGIEASHLPTIFEQFSQSGRAGGRGLGGTGLGLATAKKLAVLMGGGLSVQSRPGAGSEFRFEFPVDIDKQTEPIAETRRRLIELRIHDGVLRDALGSYLADQGFVEPPEGQAPEALVIALYTHSELEIQEAQRALAKYPMVRTLVLCHPRLKARAHELVADRVAHVIAGAVVGTKFIEWLRVGSAVEAPSPTAVMAPHVLIVEDNPVNQRLMTAMVGRLGMTSEVASNGAEGVKMASTTHFDLILMDCLMPVLDGYDATRQIRTLPDIRRDLPIIAVTANALEGDREKCLNVGMNDFMSKPVNLDTLRNVLKKWIVLPEPPISVLKKAQ